MKTILVQAHELAIAHGISAEEAIAKLETLEGEDIWLIYHNCQEPHVCTVKLWSQMGLTCPKCHETWHVSSFNTEKAKLFPCEHSSYSQYLKNRDRVPTEVLREGDNIIFEWIVPEDYPRSRDRLDDVAEAYRITENENAASGILYWAKYRGEWHCNPTNIRPLVKYLWQVGFNRMEDQDDTEDAIAENEPSYRELCRLDVTIKVPSTGQSRPFEMMLVKHEDGYWWWGSDSTEKRRIANFFGEIEDAIAEKQDD